MQVYYSSDINLWVFSCGRGAPPSTPEGWAAACVSPPFPPPSVSRGSG